MLANPHRNEAVVTIAGKKYLLRATLGAIAKIESALDCGIADISEVLKRGRLGDAIVMLKIMSDAADSPIPQQYLEDLSLNDFGEAFDLGEVYAAFADALGGGAEEENQKKTANRPQRRAAARKTAKTGNG